MRIKLKEEIKELLREEIQGDEEKCSNYPFEPNGILYQATQKMIEKERKRYICCDRCGVRVQEERAKQGEKEVRQSFLAEDYIHTPYYCLHCWEKINKPEPPKPSVSGFQPESKQYKTCKECGSRFKGRGNYYCSHACRQKVSNRRRREYYKKTHQ